MNKSCFFISVATKWKYLCNIILICLQKLSLYPWLSNIIFTVNIRIICFILRFKIQMYICYCIFIKMSLNSSRKGFTSGAGTTNPSWVHSRFSVGFLLLLFCIVFCRSLFVLFSFGNCIVCPSIYGFWLHFWYKHRLPKSRKQHFGDLMFFIVIVSCPQLFLETVSRMYMKF
jgi:hypothetical protein